MNFNTCAKRETFPKASWTALSSKHTSSPKNLPEAILILYSMCSDRDWYSAAPPWRQSGTQGWAIKPECPMSPQKASPVPSKGAVSQLSGSARTRNLSSQPRYCFSNNFCKRGFCPGLAKLAAWLSGLSWSLFSQESMALCRSTALEWRQPMLFPSPGQLQGTFGTGTHQLGFWAYSTLQILHPWDPVLYCFITKALQILQEIWTQESIIFCWHSKVNQGKIISMCNLEREIIHIRQSLPGLNKII